MIDLSDIFAEEVPWQMSKTERAVMLYLISQMPVKNMAIEIGSLVGGSLKRIARNFQSVYSLDIDHDQIDKSVFDNVAWLLGDSKETLPTLIDILTKRQVNIDFILYDGDHEYEAALPNLQIILGYKPQTETLILVHDSWYPGTRKALDDIPWGDYSHVRLVEYDIAVGNIWTVPENLIHPDLIPGQKVTIGGFALIVLSSEKMEQTIGKSADHVYQPIQEISHKSRIGRNLYGKTTEA